MEIYHRTGVRMIGIGYCGPNEAINVPADEAQKMSTWPDWSLAPFARAKEPESKPKRKTTKVVKNAQ